MREMSRLVSNHGAPFLIYAVFSALRRMKSPRGIGDISGSNGCLRPEIRDCRYEKPAACRGLPLTRADARMRRKNERRHFALAWYRHEANCWHLPAPLPLLVEACLFATMSLA